VPSRMEMGEGHGRVVQRAVTLSEDRVALSRVRAEGVTTSLVKA
jgi:hypothetical protein